MGAQARSGHLGLVLWLTQDLLPALGGPLLPPGAQVKELAGVCLPRAGCGAGSRIPPGRPHQPRPGRGVLDVADRTPQMLFAQSRGEETVLPQMPATAVQAVTC